MALVCPLQQLTSEQEDVGQQRFKRMHVTLSVESSPGFGLWNQHASLLELLTAAVAVGADAVVLPTYQHRTAFRRDAEWQRAPGDELWDADRIVAYLGGEGIRLFREGEPLQDLPPDTHHISYELQCCHGHKHCDVADLATALRQSIREHLAVSTEAPHYSVCVQLSQFFLSLQTPQSCMYLHVGMNIGTFAPALVATANRIISAIREELMHPVFNGLHLRLEDDIAELVENDGGLEHYADLYAQALGNLSFSTNMPMYVASALFSDEATGGAGEFQRRALVWLREELAVQFSSGLLHKEQFLTAQELEGFTSEQRAAIDSLVLFESSSFVGYSTSSMSYMVQEYRALLRRPRSTSFLVAGGHKQLFGGALAFADEAQC
ncbi:hypothetical protein COCOBI_05-2770 [Coccomyxa sp. Obi]|nr:hypothetical protein COCOBI_05-2770 [Coccomyxa sp. Obi]